MSDKSHAVVLNAKTREVAPQGMHPMAAAILANNPDAETLGKLMEMQRDHEANEARKAYDVALVALKGALPTVLSRDKSVTYNGSVKYTHTSLAAAMEAVDGHLNAHGFTLTWRTGDAERGGVRVTCRLAHVQGHYGETSLSAPPDGSGSKSGAQAVASTVTLLQRHTALSLLGIATADMKDPAPAEPDPNAIDTARNLKAVGGITSRGKSIVDARAQVGGRGPEAWTTADLDVLRKWVATPVSDDPEQEAALDRLAAEEAAMAEEG